MTPSTPRTAPFSRRLGGGAALLASAAIFAACSSAGSGYTNPPAVTSAPAATSAPATGAAAAGLTLAVRQNATLGSYVAGKDGMSLYIFEKDTAGTSACTGNCAGTWPPLTVASLADVTAGAGVTGLLGTIQRADGTLQVTLAGRPLYYYAGDSAAGDTSGQGKNDVWYLASPSGDPIGEAAATPAAATPAGSKCGGPACY